jgi:mono/diheme cytochrome c family protein
MLDSGYRITLKAALALAATLGVGACGLFGKPYVPPPPPSPPVPAEVKLLNQGPQWDQANRAAFYTQDQGSRIMPLAWFKALRLSDNTGFTADGLARFGYLLNPDSPAGLPVGFTTGAWQNADYVGMTCAACHTRQIRVDGAYYRVDGGPALSNLQSLFGEMDAAVQRVLANDANFAAFAAEVLGKDAPPAAVAQLRADVTAWAGPYHTLISKALPRGQAWGVGRADAVGMILNRLGGLDIGTTPDHVIAGNIEQADAPTRYPFLWNATIQDKTQWPGFAPNGNDLYGLIRNLGEVYGVFAVLHPTPRPGWVGGVDYISVNSGNFEGLDRVEQMARRIGKPAWPVEPNKPHAIDQDRGATGKKLYYRVDRNGLSCASCHGIVTQQVPLLPATWKTPLSDVGTDSREYGTLERQGDSGVMNGAYLLLPGKAIQPRDSLVTVLSTATAGAILQKAGLRQDPLSPSQSLLLKNPQKNEPLVVNAMQTPPPETTAFKYEARVLQGIWAAAPYLHNGSVPTLADLLEPSDKRPARFDVGIDYDLDKIGLAATQTGAVVSTTETTGCEARDSGNSRCGHEGVGFGTMWTPEEKQALLEYLKTL